ncbi:MAG: SCO family protein [Acidimicrobiales bacterium]
MEPRAAEDKLVLPRWSKIALGLFVAVIAAAMAFAIFEPIQVLPRIRLAPGYAFADQTGETMTSEMARGHITLYTFAPTECGSDCDDIFTTMDDVGRRVDAEVDLGQVDFQRITIALDADPTAEDLAAAEDRSGADADSWRWIGGDDTAVRTVVGAGFGRFYEIDEKAPDGPIRFDPGFVLVDGAGVIRGEYRYQTLATDADKLVHHVDILAAEARNAHGATAVAYEAAHLFLCYP